MFALFVCATFVWSFKYIFHPHDLLYPRMSLVIMLDSFVGLRIFIWRRPLVLWVSNIMLWNSKHLLFTVNNWTYVSSWALESRSSLFAFAYLLFSIWKAGPVYEVSLLLEHFSRNAWNKLGAMPTEEAMEEYIAIVDELFPNWADGSSAVSFRSHH